MQKNPYYDPTKSHHTMYGFTNTEPFELKTGKAITWQKDRNPRPPQGGYELFSQKWTGEIDLSLPDDRAWWIGHSTTLIRLNDKMILTDPIFSERTFPSQRIGPQRRTPAALTIEQLPHIDVIVISHNHYDHLDTHSILNLLERFPQVTILVPLVLKQKLVQWGAKQVIELDWWDSAIIEDITFTAVPAKHWSHREFFDINKTLWCGWVMQPDVSTKKKPKSVYFMGDTGYSPKLKEIGKRFPSIDLALIPIGAYSPRRVMNLQHIDPEHAVQLFDELRCKSAMAIYWGTFELAEEPIDEPAELLNSIRGDRPFYTLKVGESMPIGK